MNSDTTDDIDFYLDEARRYERAADHYARRALVGWLMFLATLPLARMGILKAWHNEWHREWTSSVYACEEMGSCLARVKQYGSVLGGVAIISGPDDPEAIGYDGWLAPEDQYA